MGARNHVDGAALVELVPPGSLERPSGLELHDGLVFVTDAATGRFHAFDRDGRLVRSLDTGLPAGALAGFAFGTDGRIVFVDRLSGRVLRIDP